VAGGSNVTLGWIVLLLVLIQIAVLVSYFGDRVPVVSRALALLATSALLFAPQGSWNFVRAMSGTAWLSANLCAVAAIALRSRSHRAPAVVLGVLASLSYSTGLLVWPALIVTGIVRDRKVRLEWPTALGAVLTLVWYLDRYRHIDHTSTLDNSSQLPLRNAGMLLGSIFTGGDPVGLTRWIGWLMIAVAVTLAVVAMRRDPVRAAPWTGLCVYALGGAGLIALGRNLLLGDFSASRYCSIGALLVVSAIGNLIVSWPKVLVHALVCGGVALMVSLPGGDVVDDLQKSEPDQELLAIAQRLDLADGSRHWYALFGEAFPNVTPELKAIGHYPFDHRFTADCGLLGRRIPDDAGAWQVGVGRGRASRPEPMRNVPHAVRISGTVGGDARCVVITNRERRVVGMGVVHRNDRARTSSPDTFIALAPEGDAPYEVFALPDQ
jgi:hypothetical protein